MAVVKFVQVDDDDLLIKGISYWDLSGFPFSGAVYRADEFNGGSVLDGAFPSDDTFWNQFEAREDEVGIAPSPRLDLYEATDSEVIKQNYDTLRARIDEVRKREGSPVFQWGVHSSLPPSQVYSRPEAHCRYPTDLRIAMQYWQQTSSSFINVVLRTNRTEFPPPEVSPQVTDCTVADQYMEGLFNDLATGGARGGFAYSLNDNPITAWRAYGHFIILYSRSFSGPPSRTIFDIENYIEARGVFKYAVDELPTKFNDAVTIMQRWQRKFDDWDEVLSIDVVDLGEDLTGKSAEYQWQAIDNAPVVGQLDLVSFPAGVYANEYRGASSDSFTRVGNFVHLAYKASQAYEDISPPSLCNHGYPTVDVPLYNTIQPFYGFGYSQTTVDRWSPELVGITFDP